MSAEPAWARLGGQGSDSGRLLGPALHAGSPASFRLAGTLVGKRPQQPCGGSGTRRDPGLSVCLQCRVWTGGGATALEAALLTPQASCGASQGSAIAKPVHLVASWGVGHEGRA